MNKFLRYSGVIQPVSTLDAIREKTIQIESYDFLKTMELYPAYKVSDAFGAFFQISGLSLRAYHVPGEKRPEPGVKELTFKYPAEKSLARTTILEISSDTKPGRKFFSYRSWGWFQWDNGPWTQKDLGEESTIEAWDGSTIKCRYAGFTQEDATDIVEIQNGVVVRQGGIQLSFDEGNLVRLGMPYSFVLRETVTDLFNITTECLVGELGSVIVIDDNTDVLYIGAVDRFQAIEFDFDTFLSGTTLNFEYSRSSWNEWANLAGYITEESTQNFSQSGTLRFNLPNNWFFAEKKVGEIGSPPEDLLAERYWIRISVNSWGSGSAAIRQVRRGFYLIGKNGDSLEVEIEVEKIQECDITESVIIRQSDTDASTYVPAVWKKNIPIESLLGFNSGSDPSSSLPAASGFTEICRNIEELSYDLPKAGFSIWGIPPFPAYLGKPRSICGRHDASGDTLWIGIGEEVWEVSDHTEFKFLFKLKTYYDAALDRPFKTEIRRLNYIASENALSGMAWKPYNDERFRPIQDTESNADWGRCTPASVFQYDLNSGSLTQRVIGPYVSGKTWTCLSPQFYSGEVFYRDGNHAPATPHPMHIIGNIGYFDQGGENITIPEPTFVSIRRPSENWKPITCGVLCRVPQFLDIPDSGFARAVVFDFSYDDTLTGPHGDFCLTKPGWHFFYYVITTEPWSCGPVSLRFDFGQPGFVLWNDSRKSYIFRDRIFGLMLLQRHLTPPDQYSWFFDTLKSLPDVNEQLSCGAMKDNDNFFYSNYWWYDLAHTPPSPPWDPMISEVFIQRFNIPSQTITALLFDPSYSTALGPLSGHVETSGPIDLGYDPDNGVIHCTFLDRKTLRYYYVIVKDSHLDPVYSTQIGENFIFDWSRPFKKFIFLNGKMYSVCTDDRHQTEDAFLVEATFSEPTITLRKIGVIHQGDYSVETMTVIGDTLYGISKPSNTMWSYGTKWVPRVQLADFEERNCREVATDLCQAVNAILRVDPDRVVIVEKRETLPLDVSILDDELVEVKPEKPWKFIYDGCEVKWSFLDQSGTEAWGLTGRNQRILRISNPMIQDSHFAKRLAEIYGKFFFKKRSLLPIIAKYLPQFERGDLVKVISEGVDAEKRRRIATIRLRNSNGQTEMGLVEQ